MRLNLREIIHVPGASLPFAFQLDLSDLDLSDIDMSDVELPDMDALDLSQLFADMDLSVSEDALQSLMKKIMNRYKRYIIGNGISNPWATCWTPPACRSSSPLRCSRTCRAS